MLGDVYQLWTGSLRFQEASYTAAESSDGLTLALIIFVLAAFSKGLSEAGVMMINRVTQTEFVRRLFGGAVLLGITAATWSGCMWLALRGGMGFDVEYRKMLLLVLLSYAPMIFAVFSIVPHAGLLWGLILRIWMLLITIAGLQQHFRVPLFQAVLASGVGWVLFQFVGELFRSKLERLRFALLGREHWVSPKEAAEALLARRMSGE